MSAALFFYVKKIATVSFNFRPGGVQPPALGGSAQFEVMSGKCHTGSPASLCIHILSAFRTSMVFLGNKPLDWNSCSAIQPRIPPPIDQTTPTIRKAKNQ